MPGMRSSNDGKIYVGNLPPDIRTRDIEDMFCKFGKIMFVDLKNKNGPPFAFLEFDDPRDAQDAVKSRDGYNYDGYTLRVEFPKGSVSRNLGDSASNSSSSRVRGGGPPPASSRRSDYRVRISGLPSTGSWQDIKDHMREAGDVCYADVFNDGTGVVEFVRYDDMKYAVRKLDDTKFRSHEGEVSYIRVKEDRGGHGRSRSRSRSRHGRSRASPSYSPMRRPRSRSS